MAAISYILWRMQDRSITDTHSTNADLISRVCAYVEAQNGWGESVETNISGLAVYAVTEPTSFECFLYQSVICLILQGSKETLLGEQSVKYGAGKTLIISHDIHVCSRVTEASIDEPYVALVVAADLGIVRDLEIELGDADQEEESAVAFDVSDTSLELLAAIHRYFSLLEDASDARVLGPLLLKEIHYRLLTTSHGGMLRRLIRQNSHASRIAAVIDHIRRHFAEPLVIADLADVAGMSVSSFHEHFKSITATTPLQYQKDLRLFEARRLLTSGQHSVSATAYEVGYESATQFSREYTRRFGGPPRNDIPTNGSGA